MNQVKASRKVLEESQKEEFPFTIKEFGLEIVVQRGIFSPKHFNGWRVFTKHFPNFSGEDILEIGSGHGATSVYLAKNGARRVVAVDINPLAIENTLYNKRINCVENLEVRLSDIYSAIDNNERFDTIYWNTPFIYVPEDYQYKSMLERALFDPGYKLTERFLKEGKDYLKLNGRILFGTGNFGNMDRFKELAEEYGYLVKFLVKEDSTEINQVDFQLYEIRRKDGRI